MDNTWNYTNIESLNGKVIIITGANSGLGYESTKLLASKGATVIMAVRSMEKGLEARSMISQDISNCNIDLMSLDLGNLESIKNFSESFKSKYERLDILLNNAGIMNTPYGLTKDGFEQQIGVNHLGHFALTGRLLNLLKKTPSSRIVNISSLMHKKGSINFEDLFFQNNTYTPEKAYAQSKLANLLFTYQLNSFLKENHLDIKVLAAHPGGAKTNLGRYSRKSRLGILLKKFIYPHLMQNAEDGAMSGIRAALDKDIMGGTYLGPSGIFESKGKPVIVKPSPSALDSYNAKKLWTVSEKLTGVIYNF